MAIVWQSLFENVYQQSLNTKSSDEFINSIVDNFDMAIKSQGKECYGNNAIVTNVSVLKLMFKAALVYSIVNNGGKWDNTAYGMVITGLVLYWSGAMLTPNFGPSMSPNIPISNVVVFPGIPFPVDINAYVEKAFKLLSVFTEFDFPSSATNIFSFPAGMSFSSNPVSL